MKKIIKSAFLVVAIAAVAGYATYSFFSDTESSTGNAFAAGKIDLLFTNANDKPFTSPLFSELDMKPGDMGEVTTKLKVDNNPACGKLSIAIKDDKDNDCTEPEAAVEGTNCPLGDVGGKGELNDVVNFVIWKDNGATKQTACNNELDSDETALVSGPLTSDKVYSIGDIPNEGNGDCYGIAYCFGVWSSDFRTCDGSSASNISQTDSFKADVVIDALQKRNQFGDNCPAVGTWPNQGQQSLALENEIQNASGPWTPKIGDNIKGLLTWQGDGTDFVYTLTAQGLPFSAAYSLIYYADPFPGNNPGALIGTFTTDGSGNINQGSTSTNLGMDLPAPSDANYPTGAKIWLIPSANYNLSTKEVTPWAPNDTWLFEGNVFIHYNDTNN